jgi:hypothetical protein
VDKMLHEMSSSGSGQRRRSGSSQNAYNVTMMHSGHDSAPRTKLPAPLEVLQPAAKPSRVALRPAETLTLLAKQPYPLHSAPASARSTPPEEA